jgi:hypothetical protein
MKSMKSGPKMSASAHDQDVLPRLASTMELQAVHLHQLTRAFEK